VQGSVDQQPWLSTTSALGVAAVFFLVVLVCILLSFVMAWWSGWALLARKFRARSKFTEKQYSLKDAKMRWPCEYWNCMIVGANSEGLFLSLQPVVKVFHPDLFIPWSEVHITSRNYFHFSGIGFELGNELRVPIFLCGDVVDDLEKAAGASWPLERLG
jgi:hypothetical protein